MVGILRLADRIIGYTLVAVCFILSVLAMLGVINAETVSEKKGWLMFLYLVAIIFVIYKIASFLITSLYQSKIKRRKEYLHSIAGELSKDIQNQNRVVDDGLAAVIEEMKRMPDAGADVLVAMLQERLPDVVQKLVDQQVADVKRNLEKENEERIREITLLSAGVADVLDRRNRLLDLEKEIRQRQEDARKDRLAITTEYTMLVFSLAGTPVEDVEKVCDVVKLFIETGQVPVSDDFHISQNKKLRNAELKQFVTNIIKFNGRDGYDAESFILTVFGEWFSGRKENISKSFSALPKDSLVSKDGLEADLLNLSTMVASE